jgi:predicted membrane-bound spermidine synthase
VSENRKRSPNLPRRALFFLIFTVSGFSGLIYESIWTHYLKLFLGHAAYAQTLVLTIFMAGLALGSWIASRFSTRWKNLLLGYAIVEGIIGFFGLIFHGTFIAATNLAYETILPGLGSDASAATAIWMISGLLILPQSILLGMTFPLMSAAMIRQDPDHPGESISMLYFTNSLGAGAGVLVSGFFLIERFGLPGTVWTAGGLNLLVALAVVLLIRKFKPPLDALSVRNRGLTATDGSLHTYLLFLFISFVTGLSSFIYEIGWIRMLSLVLGSSTHAFELMLSAFIFGLAFGGLWIRRRLDRFADPVKVLGMVQVVMGCLAVSTLLLYGNTFEMMHLLVRKLGKTESGYAVFNVSSHAIALLVMFPATFFAGMTLPLITYTLIAQGHGEKSIGAVYAANTVGAIAGVLSAVHLGMPLLGLKGLIVSGAGLDIAAGLLLLWIFCRLPSLRWAVSWTCVGIVVLLTAAFWINLDPLKMASGVYRWGDLFSPTKAQVIFHRDGKTATVNTVKIEDYISLRVNGKADASLTIAQDGNRTMDENTMILLGILPVAYNREAKTAAVIGFGSGLTTHSLLQSPRVERVDTIEIEPMVVEASKIFRPRVEAAYTDPRSHLYIDDAKAYFAVHKKKYDMIVSEPSNPWVGGVSSLFTDEFYQAVTRHLNADGILVQWVQLYETETRLLASVMKALARHFEDYVLYVPDDSDLIIVAKNKGAMPLPDDGIFGVDGIKRLLERLDIYTEQDLEQRELGNKKVFDPFFQSFSVPINSDYHPFLDLYAVRARYLGKSAFELARWDLYPFPAVEMLSGKRVVWKTTEAHRNFGVSAVNDAYNAMGIRDFYLKGAFGSYSDFLNADIKQSAERVKSYLSDCGFITDLGPFQDSVYKIAAATLPHLASGESHAVWESFERYPCYQKLPDVAKDYFSLFKAIGGRDAENMVRLSAKLLEPFHDNAFKHSPNLVRAGMLGYLAQGRREDALQVWKTHAPDGVLDQPPDLLMRLVLAHSGQRLN